MLDVVHTSVSNVLAAILVLSSPLLLFFGARLVKYVVGISGFLVGAYFGFILALKLDAIGYVPLIGAAVGGVIGIIVFGCILRYAIGLIGFIAGMLAANFIYQVALSHSTLTGTAVPAVQVIVVIIGGAIGAILLRYFQHAFLAAVTAFVGGYAAAAGVGHFCQEFGWIDFAPLQPESFLSNADEKNFACTEAECWGFVIMWFALAVIGFTVQMKFVRPREKEALPFTKVYIR
eukprot:GILJ01012845.1.p1 GENE.GILJ01012845.1~~GILJ01012845.1.p1  ORF type:complete len:233 (+),score=29.17 GILJ01012845.1:483-1181(+)